MTLLMCVLWAACSGTLWGQVHRLPPFQHASEPLVARETFRPGPDKRPLPDGLSALLLPPAGRQQPRGVPPSPPGPVDVWCGLRQVSVRVDRLRLQRWNIPALFRFGSCGVSAASPRYLYFHRGLSECGGTGQVVRGQLVYTYPLTYNAPRYGSVLRVPPLKMALSCHYNRFHYSYRVGFQPQASPSIFLKSVRSQTSFSLSVCNNQWEVLPPEHSFILGELVYFSAQAGGLRPGERLYVDSCHATSSNHSDNPARLDIITNFGCMVDSIQTDSKSHFVWRGPSEVRFSVDSLLFSSEEQMLFLHCSMSVGHQPSPSSKSCTYNKVTRRWQELEASPIVCECCASICEDSHGADSTTVSSAAWYLAKPPEKPNQGLTQLHQQYLSQRRGPGRMEVYQGEVSPKRGPGLMEVYHGEVSPKRGPGLMEVGEVSTKSRPGLMEVYQGEVSPKNRPSLMEVYQGEVSPKRGPGLMEVGEVSTKSRPGLMEVYQGEVSPKRGPGLMEVGEVSTKSRPGLMEVYQGEVYSKGQSLMDMFQGEVSTNRTLGLTKVDQDVGSQKLLGLTELHREEPGLTDDASLMEGPDLMELHQKGVALTTELVERNQWDHSQEASTTEYTETRQSSQFLKRALTNHTSAQNQSTTATDAALNSLD